MKIKIESWEDQHQRRVDEFIGDWNWEKVFRRWSSRLDDFSIELEPLFQVVRVHDPENPSGKQSELAWWPIKSIQSEHMRCQRHFDKHPGTRGLTHPDAIASSVGERTTIKYLWESKTDPEIVAAILIAGSLFSRIGSTRKHYPENWPPFLAVKVVADWAYSRWLGSEQHSAWHSSCTTVLPWESEDYVYKIDSMHALIRYIAEEHASLLIKYRPVIIEFGTERDPFIANALNQEYKTEQQRHAKWNIKMMADVSAEKQRVAALKLKHPRYGEWGLISLDELERLVWSKATSQLAAEFGVSDVAIGKRCKALGIIKPPQGFWNKVVAGKIPHPEGQPLTKRVSNAKNPNLKIVR